MGHSNHHDDSRDDFDHRHFYHPEEDIQFVDPSDSDGCTEIIIALFFVGVLIVLFFLILYLGR